MDVFRLLILVLSLSSFSPAAQEFVVGVEDISYYPLYDFPSGRGGYTKDLLDEFGRQYGHKFVYLPLPIKRFSRWLIEHQIDFKYPDNVRWNPDGKVYKDFVYSDATISLVAGTMTLSEKYHSREQIKVLGTLLGFHPTQWINEIKAGDVKLYEHSSTLVLIQQVLRGHVDGIDLEPSVVNYHLKLLGKNEALTVNKNMSYEVYNYYLSTIRHKDVIAQFNEFLRRNQGYLKKLRAKYQIIDISPYTKKPAISGP